MHQEKHSPADFEFVPSSQPDRKLPASRQLRHLSLACYEPDPLLHRPADCSRTRTSREEPLLLTIPGAGLLEGIDPLLFRNPFCSQSRYHLCNGSRGHVAGRWHPRTRASPHSANRSRRVTAAADSGCPMPAPISSSAPPGAPTEKAAAADADRSSCPHPQGRSSASRSLQDVEAYLIRRACRVRPRVRFLLCRACVACWNRRICRLRTCSISGSSACSLAAVLRGGACLVGRARTAGESARAVTGEAATSAVGMDQRSTHAGNFSERARTFVQSRKHHC
jgi:hypothetical protein